MSNCAIVCEMAGGVEGTAEVVGGEGDEKELEPGEADMVSEWTDGLHEAVGRAVADTIALCAHAAVEDVAGTGSAPSAELKGSGTRPNKGICKGDLLCSRRRGKITEISWTNAQRSAIVQNQYSEGKSWKKYVSEVRPLWARLKTKILPYYFPAAISKLI